ncbi:related to bifunctional P-protein (chorismate mutase-P/prephenate dehydratase) [Serendipita indica DSM 11827]|uniref:prephenate dehydratase n=1 Tax=Serendipita indica (strain DSM 11827) TaxID=1109443 RepID=G4TKZ2_SERID|nr:related to bifunctional P-protein (chorismate mutase-P/prephenate dehydratase) [Serendipita indica DSM 11827]
MATSPNGISKSKVAFLGPSGTHTHQAANNYFGDSVSYDPQPSIAKSFDALSSEIPFACLPIANSTHGQVIETLDLLRSGRWSKDVHIIGEIVMKIEHCLVIRDLPTNDKDEGVLQRIKTVWSHEQALGQCSSWLTRHLPNAAKIKTPSTSGAAKQLLELDSDHTCAAICPRICTSIYSGLRILAPSIQDRDDNQTRFLILGHRHHPALPTIPAPTKALIRFSIAGEISSLLSSITSAAWSSKLKILRIDRRPNPSSSPWTDVYFVEFTHFSPSPNLQNEVSTLITTLGTGTEAVILGVW